MSTIESAADSQASVTKVFTELQAQLLKKIAAGLVTPWFLQHRKEIFRFAHRASEQGYMKEVGEKWLIVEILETLEEKTDLEILHYLDDGDVNFPTEEARELARKAKAAKKDAFRQVMRRMDERVETGRRIYKGKYAAQLVGRPRIVLHLKHDLGPTMGHHEPACTRCAKADAGCERLQRAPNGSCRRCRRLKVKCERAQRPLAVDRDPKGNDAPAPVTPVRPDFAKAKDRLLPSLTTIERDIQDQDEQSYQRSAKIGQHMQLFINGRGSQWGEMANADLRGSERVEEGTRPTPTVPRGDVAGAPTPPLPPPATLQAPQPPPPPPLPATPLTAQPSQPSPSVPPQRTAQSRLAMPPRFLRRPMRAKAK